MRKNNKGSLWRRWDLHIHAPDTKLSNAFKSDAGGDVWEEYIDYLEHSNVQVFGITDYFSSDGYFNCVEKFRKRHPNSQKVFFPNIEFRLSEAINANGDSPHLHVLFDNDDNNCPREKISEFLAALITHYTDENDVEIPCSKLNTEAEFMSATVSLRGIEEALKKTFGSKTPYLLIFPAKNDGIKSTDIKSPRKILISDQIDKKCHAFFGDSSNTQYFLKDDRYKTGNSDPKPVFSGSDAHSISELERLTGDVSGFEITWIKAETSFRGLQQTLFEPEARVFIGEIPPVEKRKQEEATKFISELKIDQIPNYNEEKGIWFKDINIPLNPELTAIIGNKGSGKSAIADVIGLLGETRQYDHFSFLTDKSGNKKFKQPGYAENFQATLVWENGVPSTKLLSAQVDESKPELVKYLPQNFFEQLTNEIEVSAFRKEVEEVVFSHVEMSDRMQKNTFKELEDFKTLQSKNHASSLKTQLRALNIKISELEEQVNPTFKKSLQETLKLKEAELAALQNSLPAKMLAPQEESEEQKAINSEISELSKILDSLSEKGKIANEKLAQIKNKHQQIMSLLERVTAIDTYLEKEKAELEIVCETLGLNIDEIINHNLDKSSILNLSQETQSEIKKLEMDSKLLVQKSTDFEALDSVPDLRNAYIFVRDWIKDLKDKLSAPHKRYQNYIQKLAELEKQITTLKGDENFPEAGTINELKARIGYIENELAQKISESQTDRKKLVGNIYEAKQVVLEFYSDLKNSVETKLADVCDPDFMVSINASFVLEDSFYKRFLDLIDQKRKGPFKNKEDGLSNLKKIVNSVDLNDFESIHATLIDIISAMKSEGIIEEQTTSVKELYDFMFSLDYFEPKYELRLDGKNLNQLSPGEKGLLLLVFYLHLDKENTPLIIDQPEDNLDNDSIFKVLARCIREAKKNRQVILVTHNPNLAVGADAEEVVYVKLEKANNYNFIFESGAIEESLINKKIIKVLEGSRPAFVQRRLVYNI